MRGWLAMCNVIPAISVRVVAAKSIAAEFEVEPLVQQGGDVHGSQFSHLRCEHPNTIRSEQIAREAIFLPFKDPSVLLISLHFVGRIMPTQSTTTRNHFLRMRLSDRLFRVLFYSSHKRFNAAVKIEELAKGTRNVSLEKAETRKPKICGKTVLVVCGQQLELLRCRIVV